MAVQNPVLRRIPASIGAAKALQILKDDGAVVIQNFLTSAQLLGLNEEINPQLVKRPFVCESQGEWKSAVPGAHTKRLNQLPAFSQIFRQEILNMPLMHEICDPLFKATGCDYWMNTATVVQIGPGNPAQTLHRDQELFPVFNPIGKNAPEAIVNFFCALSEFTDENGATRVIPGSHRWDDFTTDVTTCVPQTIPAEMNAGDCLLFSGKLVHGGGANHSLGNARRGLALGVQASYLTPEETYQHVPRSIVESMTPLAQKMIHWRSAYCPAAGGLWQINGNEMAAEIELKSKQPLKHTI
jgi:ectoine hydroxylase-related dioxygenase (phytanoyl-CoA dioxygenase family)